MTNENTTTFHACTVDETAGGAEMTGAVEAAAEAILEACYGQELPEAPIDLARAALAAALGVDELARVDAETTRCSWSIPQDGHPYNESCLYKRDRIDGQVSHGACWDAPYARATAIRAALLGRCGVMRPEDVPSELAERSARPFRVGDRVRISGWGSHGPHEGTVVRIDPADPDGGFGPYIATDCQYRTDRGELAIATCAMTSDLTAGKGCTVELIKPAPRTPMDTSEVTS